MAAAAARRPAETEEQRRDLEAALRERAIVRGIIPPAASEGGRQKRINKVGGKVSGKVGGKKKKVMKKGGDEAAAGTVAAGAY